MFSMGLKLFMMFAAVKMVSPKTADSIVSAIKNLFSSLTGKRLPAPNAGVRPENRLADMPMTHNTPEPTKAVKPPHR
ncbi:hypothetical protein HHE014_08780 [Helicobacter heilmannii]|nr:hypothetical protein ASB1_18120 [Helicobacter heilmannii]GLH58546.1 hypothetical protein NHP214376_13370 [Helicobacter ailurogastricus]GLH60026.1 hypothetical protein NHP214377_12980 [Helicobacter ailurogastricus]CRF45899.1 hypothetical protein HHE014_08780 [Helicobacter heilmannii]